MKYGRYKNKSFVTFGATLIMALILTWLPGTAFAVPEVVDVRVTDVTTTSFSLVWMTNVSAEPTVEVYTDSAKTNSITDKLTVMPMPIESAEVVGAARSKGIMKVRVSGLAASTTYYVRAVTNETGNPLSIGYSPLREVTTADMVMPYSHMESGVEGFSNDMAQFKVYVRPSVADDLSGLGDMIILESEEARYPVSAFVGDGISAPWGILDLNNLFGEDGRSLDISGGERLVMTVYRSGMMSTLTHYRRSAQDEGMVFVVEPEKGFFADIDLDSNVNDSDFDKFKAQYRTLPDDETYNPDYNFVEDSEGVVDVREFSKFSREFGRTDVE